MNERVEAGRREGWIYFIQAGSQGAIKIGWAKDPAKRIRTLQTSQHQKLKMLGAIPGTLKDEQALHRRFADARLNGEWFDRSKVGGQVMSLILSEGFIAAKPPKSRIITGEFRENEYCLVISDS